MAHHEIYASAIMTFSLTLIMTFTFDLWPWKLFQQRPLIWWICMPSFIEIPPLSAEISHC